MKDFNQALTINRINSYDWPTTLNLNSGQLQTSDPPLGTIPYLRNAKPNCHVGLKQVEGHKTCLPWLINLCFTQAQKSNQCFSSNNLNVKKWS
jgi:hypothetical protein